MQRKHHLIISLIMAAVEDWQERKICLPSLTIAIALESTKWGQLPECKNKNCFFPERHDGIRFHKTVKEAVRSHNDYLLEWKADACQNPNWQKLIGQENYILATQYLQEAEYPYSPDKSYEATIIGLIEKYHLTIYDDIKKEELECLI